MKALAGKTLVSRMRIILLSTIFPLLLSACQFLFWDIPPYEYDEYIALDTTAQAGDWSVAVVGWWQSLTVENFILKPGEKIIAVDTILRNQSAQYNNFYPGSQLKLKDSFGQSYLISDIYYTFEERLNFAGTNSMRFAPGEHFRHRFIFRVPNDSRLMALQVFPMRAGNDSEKDVASIPLRKGDSHTTLPADMITLDPGAYSLGTAIEIGDIQIAILEWKILPADNAAAQDGNQNSSLVMIEFLIANMSPDTPFPTYMGHVHFGLKDSTGQSFPPSEAPYFYELYVQDMPTLFPGEKGMARLFFQIPPTATDLELYAQYNGPLQNPAPEPVREFIALGSQPSRRNAPEGMPGELVIDPHGTSDPVTIGTFEISNIQMAIGKKYPCDNLHPEMTCIRINVMYDLQNIGESPVDPDDLRNTLKNGSGREFRACLDKLSRQSADPGETVNRELQFVVTDESDIMYLVLYSEGGGEEFVVLT